MTRAPTKKNRMIPITVKLVALLSHTIRNFVTDNSSCENVMEFLYCTTVDLLESADAAFVHKTNSPSRTLVTVHHLCDYITALRARPHPNRFDPCPGKRYILVLATIERQLVPGHLRPFDGSWNPHDDQSP